MSPELALAASAREWPDRLHRHLLDHGGAQVVKLVMAPDQATGSRFDVLVIDDISSFLTPHLVTLVKKAGSEVIGVFDPEDGSDAKRRLLECGIGDVIESDASPDEFLRAIHSTMAHRLQTVPTSPAPAPGAWSIGVTGATDGVGATEVAVGLSCAISESLDTTLVDLDPVWPSVAPRLDLPLHPNLRTAIDKVLHDSGAVGSALHQIDSLAVVGGLADHGSAAPVSHTEMAMLIDVLASTTEVLVADLGAIGNGFGAVLSRFDSVALVGAGDPVGMARLLRTIERLLGIIDPEDLVVVINKTPGGRYHSSEIRAEMATAYPRIPTILMPHDRRVTDSAWDGSVSEKGSFARSLKRMTGLIEDSVRR